MNLMMTISDKVVESERIIKIISSDQKCVCQWSYKFYKVKVNTQNGLK